MSEQFPTPSQQDPIDQIASTHDGNPDYLEHHPNAVQDPARAKEMAHASKRFEEDVVTLAKAAEEASLNNGVNIENAPKLNSRYFPSPATADRLIEEAIEVRGIADRAADMGSDNYDRQLEVAAKVDALKRGEIPEN